MVTPARIASGMRTWALKASSNPVQPFWTASGVKGFTTISIIPDIILRLFLAHEAPAPVRTQPGGGAALAYCPSRSQSLVERDRTGIPAMTGAWVSGS